jgi:alpha-L-arabinofuranosidase
VGTAKLVTLSAHDTQATNSIGRPNQVVPVEIPLHNVTNHLSRTMPAYSIQVIEFEEQ